MLRFKTWIYLVVGGLLMSSLIGEEGEKSSEKKEGELETEKEDVENEVKESVAQKLGRIDLISPKKKEEMKISAARKAGYQGSRLY